MKFIIDRFEDECAVIELFNGEITEIYKNILPIDAKEGDILEIIIHKDETLERKKCIQDRFEKLLND